MKLLDPPQLAQFQKELADLLHRQLDAGISNWILLAGSGPETYTNRYPAYLPHVEMRARLLSLFQEVEYSRILAGNPKVRFMCGDGTWIEVDLRDINKRPPEVAP